jgi:hypothetical protein
MFPSRLVVRSGAVVAFRMTKYSRQVHTATLGPVSYLTTVRRAAAVWLCRVAATGSIVDLMGVS